MTRAPAARARAAVPSVLPPSTTMTSPMTSRGTARTTSPIVSASSSTGMISATPAFVSGGTNSQAPAQSAIGAACRRCVAQQLMAKFSVGFAVPDLAQRLLRRLSERERVVAAHRELRDAARQRPAVRGEIHQGPRPRAQRPRPLLVRAPQAGARLGGAGRVEENTVLRRAPLGLADQRFLALIEMLEQRLLRARQALAVRKIHEPLQVHFPHVDRMGKIDEGGKLADRLLQPGEPERYPRVLGSKRALQRAEFV